MGQTNSATLPRDVDHALEKDTLLAKSYAALLRSNNRRCGIKVKIPSTLITLVIFPKTCIITSHGGTLVLETLRCLLTI
jgi:hypothetical protein